jgi:cell division protein FtsI (penicillin-binding protein 3)
MKGILAAIALEDHVIDTRRRIYCENGEWHVGGRVVHDDSRQQWLDLAGIIEVSSNIGAAKIALALGARRFHQGLNAFGFGGKTGIDLPGEASGLLAAPAKWRTIELADHGFGQGVAVTPIQLATAYAAIANGGVVMRPFVVKAAYDATGHEILRRTPQAVRRAVSPDVAHKVNQLLRGVIDAHDGTGHLAQVADFTVAGKTGTAQMVNPATHSYDPNRLVVSFVGFLPADDPRLVILVVLYDVPRGSFGGIVAAPVFSEIASDALRHLDITPSPGSGSYDVASLLPFTSDGDEFAGVAEESTGAPITHTGDNRLAAFAPTTTEEQARAPDFRGLSLRHALALARRYGLQLDVKGAGYVRGQEPRAGALMDRGTVQLALSSEDDVATNLRTVAAGLNPHWIRSGMRGEREDRRSRSLQ